MSWNTCILFWQWNMFNKLCLRNTNASQRPFFRKLWPWQATLTLLLKKGFYTKEYKCEIWKLYHLPYHSKAMTNEKVFADKQTDKLTDGQRTGQKLYTPDLQTRGHKNTPSPAENDILQARTRDPTPYVHWFNTQSVYIYEIPSSLHIVYLNLHMHRRSIKI